MLVFTWTSCELPLKKRVSVVVVAHKEDFVLSEL